MSDLIDRQAAIDALGEEPMVWTDSDYEIAQRNQWNVDKLAIETVPPAQPDVPDTNVGDTISRQAAIDAIQIGLDYTNDQIRALQRLPSAQPEIIRCKDCRHRIINDHYGERGYLKIKGFCELDTGDPFELGRDAENDDWFCADAERRTDE